MVDTDAVTQVNIYEAKTQLSALLARAAAGEEIVVARAGKPLARIVALAQGGGPRIAGAYRGQFSLADDFDDDLPEDLVAAFSGEHA
ncbi:MAG: type II toxin-antitoxin system prevent-host-death family antitoxin [Mycobacteriales bacterium]